MSCCQGAAAITEHRIRGFESMGVTSWGQRGRKDRASSSARASSLQAWEKATRSKQHKSTLAAEASRVAHCKAMRRRFDKKQQQTRGKLNAKDRRILEKIDGQDLRGISSQMRFRDGIDSIGATFQQGPLVSAPPARRYDLKKVAKKSQRLTEFPARWFITHPSNLSLTQEAWEQTAKSVTCTRTKEMDQ